MTTAAFSRHRSKLHHHPAAHVLNGTPLWLPLNFGKSQKFSDRFCKVPSFTADFVRNVGEEVVAFAGWIKPTKEETFGRQDFVKRVKELVAVLWPTACVKVFGSSETGLVLPTSDVDFMIDGWDGLCSESAGGSFHLEDLSDALKQNGMENILVLPHAKVPLVKFMDSQTKLCADVSFGVPNASESVVLTQTFLKRFPQALPLIVVLKTLLRQNQLNLVHRGGLSSYAVTLLVVSYLKLRENEIAQKRNLARGRGTSSAKANGLSLHAEAVAIVEQIEDGDVEAGPDPLDPYNVGRCLIGFLHYFSTTNLHNIVIAPARECPIFRVSSMARSAAVLQDPLDIKNDILRGSFNLHRVQELWWFSLHALSSYVPGLIPSILSTFINPRDFSFVSRFSVAVDPTAEPDERGN